MAASYAWMVGWRKCEVAVLTFIGLESRESAQAFYFFCKVRSSTSIVEESSCIARRTASVVVALRRRICPIVPPSRAQKSMHHQMPGLNI